MEVSQSASRGLLNNYLYVSRPGQNVSPVLQLVISIIHADFGGTKLQWISSRTC